MSLFGPFGIGLILEIILNAAPLSWCARRVVSSEAELVEAEGVPTDATPVLRDRWRLPVTVAEGRTYVDRLSAQSGLELIGICVPRRQKGECLDVS